MNILLKIILKLYYLFLLSFKGGGITLLVRKQTLINRLLVWLRKAHIDVNWFNLRCTA
jgi:hypothetical protein